MESLKMEGRKNGKIKRLKGFKDQKIEGVVFKSSHL